MELVFTPEERALIVDRVTAGLIAEGRRLLREELAERLDVMTARRAARMLGITPETLLANHKKYGLVKSVALGATNPRFFRSQILARLRGEAVKPRALAA